MSNDSPSPDRPRSAEYAGQRDPEAFWRDVRPRREPMQRRWFLPLILLLLGVSVPWYLPEGFMGPRFHGLPIWMWVALLCSVLVAIVTAVMALACWDDDEFKND